jgi:hypothetical protein
MRKDYQTMTSENKRIFTIEDVLMLNAAQDMYKAIINLLNGIDSFMVDISSPADELLSDAIFKLRNSVKKAKGL